jgi:hypothetical protein
MKQARELPADAVLALLRRRPGDLLWQFLEVLVAERGR